MLNNIDLHKDFGKLETQVAQLCGIFDKKMFLLNERLESLIARIGKAEKLIKEHEASIAIIKDEIVVLMSRSGMVEVKDEQ